MLQKREITHRAMPSSSKNSFAGGCKLSSMSGMTSSMSWPEDSFAA
jgi:hypothetical protein